MKNKLIKLSAAGLIIFFSNCTHFEHINNIENDTSLFPAIINSMHSGNIAFQKGNYEEALFHYYRYYHEHSGAVDGLIMCAKVKVAQKKYDEALMFLYQANKISPDNSGISDTIRIITLLNLEKSLKGAKEVKGAASKKITTIYDSFTSALVAENFTGLSEVSKFAPMLMGVGMVPANEADYIKKLDFYIGMLMSKSISIYIKSCKVTNVISNDSYSKIILASDIFNTKDCVYLKKEKGQWFIVQFTRNLGAGEFK